MLLGRDRERRAIERALQDARSAHSATLVLVGEPGIGKSALLAYGIEHAGAMQLLRAQGVESEAQIPFASLLELLRPALGALESVPEPQAVALESALALRPAASQERFAIGAATLSLLAAHAEQSPLLVVVDDAQWLDSSSAQALLFAIRRLVADPIAVLIGVRQGEPSLVDGAGLATLRLEGLSPEDSGALLPGVRHETASRLHALTGGNPLALLELAAGTDDLLLAAEGPPPLISSRISRAFARRVEELGADAQRALLLAATSDSTDLAVWERAAGPLGVQLSDLVAAEEAGLLALDSGRLEFRHPLVRSAIYAGAGAEARRAAHLALVGALPDRDVDRRAWHQAAAAVGSDPVAAAALEQAGQRARSRSAYASAAAAFERAARLSPEPEARGRLLLRTAEACWQSGLADRAVIVLDEARSLAADPATQLAVDALAGHIAVRRGPVMLGHAILTDAAARAPAEQGVEMLAEAAAACFYAGDSAGMLAAARRARASLPEGGGHRARFLALTAVGMAEILGGDAAAGSEALHRAVALAEGHAELREELQLLPWLALGPIFLRESATGRSLVDQALAAARARSALGALPIVLNLVARDQATTDRWALAEASYGEAIELARETDQRTDLVFALAGLAWLQARRGREQDCRRCAAEALTLSAELGTRLHEVWAEAALGELELGLGSPERAASHFEQQLRLVDELGISDVDLWPGPELVEAYVRLGRVEQASEVAERLRRGAEAKGQPWSIARALRCAAMLAPDAEIDSHFQPALRYHAQTPDLFEEGRTRLAYGERLRRARSRIRAREQLNLALEAFERLDARPWADRTRSELAATGQTLRRRDPATSDELTPQELQIALLLAGGKTTREAAASVFLSPKTVEYHLRHVYLKLGINSRTELMEALSAHD